MKKLLGILVLGLILITPSQADDIRDFQIDGMSIRDSLLNYMSEEEIKKNVIYVYPDKKFTVVKYKKSTELYNAGINVEYKSKDKTYKIYGVVGIINFKNNIESCYKKQDEIEKEISSMFDEIKKDDWGISDLDLKGTAAEGSTFKGIAFDFNNGDRINIACYHYSDVPEDNHLKIGMSSKEYIKYTKHKAEPAN